MLNKDIEVIYDLVEVGDIVENPVTAPAEVSLGLKVVPQVIAFTGRIVTALRYLFG